MRALQILEYFDDIQRPAPVIEIATNLNYPQSSASALLQSLANVGYLTYDRYARTYVPSSRVALLGNWANKEFAREGRLIKMMKELNRATGDTVMLATRNGLSCQYIHVIQATSPARLHLTLGTVRPILRCGAGFAILSTMSDADITKLVMRANAEANADDPIVKHSDLLTQIADVRKKGYAFSRNAITQGGAILAAPLPSVGGEPLMVVGIGGVSEVMTLREEHLASLLLGTVHEYLWDPLESTCRHASLSIL